MASFLKKSIAAMPLQLRLALAPKFSDVPQTIADRSFRSWISAHIHPAVRFFADKSELEEFACARFRKTPLAWYGFGGDGAALRRWAGLNTCSDSRFYNFASSPVDCEDARARVLTGDYADMLAQNMRLFNTSVPKLLHIGTGDYAATSAILNTIGDTIDTRGIVMIEKFADLQNDFRALQDYGRPYLVLGATSFFSHLAIRFAPR